MDGEADQNPPTITKPIIDDNKSDFGMESDVLTSSSSSNMAIVKIANKTIPDMYDYWKKLMLTEVGHKAYHSTG
jgi:hypothetical protein